jgi:hypothetical protein
LEFFTGALGKGQKLQPYRNSKKPRGVKASGLFLFVVAPHRADLVSQLLEALIFLERDLDGVEADAAVGALSPAAHLVIILSGVNCADLVALAGSASHALTSFNLRSA